MILLSAALVALRPRPIESAMWLMLNFFLTAALYILLGSHFVGIIQILVYAGAIVVLFVFVIFLLNLDPKELNSAVAVPWTSLVIFLAFLTFIFLSLRVAQPELMDALPPIDEEGFGTIESFSRRFLEDYIWGFEVSGILLLMAIIGVGLLAYRKPKNPERSSRDSEVLPSESVANKGKQV